MNDEPSSHERLDFVERLTEALTDQVLASQVAKRPVPEQQVQALAKAARLLHENDLPWPPMLAQVLQELADDAEAGRPEEQAAPEQDNGGSVVEGLTRFMNAFRKERGQT